MKVTVAQLNPTVGDIIGNLEKISEALITAKKDKSDIIVFPELFLVAYPPRDLLERKWFIDKVVAAIDDIMKISAKFPEIGILVGLPIAHKKTIGRGIYNSAALFYGGELIFEQHKSLLPTYDVFDEMRYFDTAPEVDVVEFKGEILGISICEDAWNHPRIWKESSIYHFDPIEELMKKGATVLINISASPFQMGKDEVRYDLIREHVKKYQVPFIYVNQVGGNDELIFDGKSICFDKCCHPIKVLPEFEEAVVTVDINQTGDKDLYKPMDKVASIHDALILGLRDYFRKCGFSKAVIGLSGGIDSAVVAALAVEALGKENVLGITMPSPYSSKGSVDDSIDLANNLGIECKEISIRSAFESYLNELEPYFEGTEPNVAEENIQARIRGNILMAFSNKFGHIVLSTGNKSEMSVGYCTLYGDMSGGLSMISDVPKTLVYELTDYINRNREIIPRAIVTKAPSAELRPDQKDEDSLPPYDVLDAILYYYVEEGLPIQEIIDSGYDEKTVKWVVRTINRSEYKRRQAAPGFKVTSKAFGVGRRIAIAAKGEI